MQLKGESVERERNLDPRLNDEPREEWKEARRHSAQGGPSQRIDCRARRCGARGGPGQRGDHGHWGKRMKSRDTERE